jgi:hypothetical protein
MAATDHRAKAEVLLLCPEAYQEFTRAVTASENLVALCDDPAFGNKENADGGADGPAEFGTVPLLGVLVKRWLAAAHCGEFAHGDVVLLGRDDQTTGPDRAVDMVVFDDTNAADGGVTLACSVHDSPEHEDTRVIPASVTNTLAAPMLFYSSLYGPPFEFHDHVYVEVDARHPAAAAALMCGVPRFAVPAAPPTATPTATHMFALQSFEALVAARARTAGGLLR